MCQPSGNPSTRVGAISMISSMPVSRFRRSSRNRPRRGDGFQRRAEHARFVGLQAKIHEVAFHRVEQTHHARTPRAWVPAPAYPDR